LLICADVFVASTLPLFKFF